MNLLVVVACLGSAAALTKVRSTFNSVPVVDIGSTLTPDVAETEPRNVLIIGTDSAARIDSDDVITRGRERLGVLADVIMILRVDPGEGTARLISIPRDSRVAVAPSWRMARINTAIAGVNGPRNLVQTIKRNFGISIDNFVQIDFQAFRDLVEVLDGVPVYFSTPVRDRNSGLAIEEPGCVMLDEVQALAYARARHYEWYEDGRWHTDSSSDHGRIARQQDFIKRALRRAADRGLRNPTTALGVIEASRESVLLDDALDVGTLLALVAEFQDFNPESLESQQIPTRYAPRGGVAYEEIIWSEADPLIDPFRGVDPDQPLAPRNVIVDVRGRDSIEDELLAVSTDLDGAGFDAEVVEGGSLGSRTVIQYGPRGRDAALLLAAQLEAIPEFDHDEDIAGFRVVLSVGSDFDGVRDQALPVEQLPADLIPSEDSGDTDEDSSDFDRTADGADDGADDESEQQRDQGDLDGAPVGAATSTTVTTSTIPGVAPTDSAAASVCR